MIKFNQPYLTGNELKNILEAHRRLQLSGDGHFTKLCSEYFESRLPTQKALLTHSCTAALEMSALLIDIKKGDEIIMPSYTFVSTANAFVLRGATPIFVDIRKDTLNIDEKLIEGAITNKTRAIVPVHYAGISCEMDSIQVISKQYKLKVIEDAAQGAMSSYKGRALGTIGDMGCFSFHETKNIICGEGGALLINSDAYLQRAEIIREKGTNRSRFFRGEIDKYTWEDVGSSYLPGEINSAFLWAQLLHAEEITNTRIKIWNYYHNGMSSLEKSGLIRRPIIPEECKHNGHMYYAILHEKFNREIVLARLKDKGVHAVFHYVPLHSSPAGLKYGRASGVLSITDDLSRRVIRLPLWVGITNKMQDTVMEMLASILKDYRN